MKKITTNSLDRRSFIKVSALAGGGMLISFYAGDLVAQRGGQAPTPATPINPNTYIKVHPDNTFTIVAKNPETGQGIKNALPMIIADEFDIDWKQVKIEQGDLDPKYGNDAGIPNVRQNEGGSTAIPQNYTGMRNVGATARAMMVATAAQTWNVPAAEITTGSGMVKHAQSNRSATYASLAAKALTMPVPALTDVKLKDPKDFKIMGQKIHGVDNAAIVSGKPSFSIDVDMPGMLFAVYEKCPVFGGKVVSANVEDIKKLPGVKHVFVVDAPPPPQAQGGRGGGGGPRWDSGVAIVADSWWLAQNARKALKVVWDEGPVATQSSVGYATQAKQLHGEGASKAPTGGGQAANIGDVEAAFASAAKVIEAEYHFPLLSHAPLEPMNSTAWFKDGKVEIWSPSQTPALQNAAVPAGVQNTDVTFHLVRAGGGFGRRLYNEYDIEVSKIARLVADERAKASQPSVPVKLLWTREDDIHHDDYRPGGYHFFKAGFDSAGKLIAFRDYVPSASGVVPANEFPRGFVANFRVGSDPIAPFNIPTGAMRAPSTNGVSFAMQGFIDELAYAAGSKDPLQFRLDLLANPIDPALASNPGAFGAPFNASRARGVLEAVRDMSDWNSRDKLPKGTAKGVAFQFAHSGYVAYVVQVTIGADKKLKVDKAWSAVDIGNQIVNTSQAESLVHGGFIEGMSHLMAWEITIDKGRVVQSNFNQYQPTRMNQAPQSIEVKFLKTNYAPTGLGEPSLPPAPPAICNAIFAATGVRIRTLPIRPQGYSWT
jgi:isoquinoline 1-oxidoreductase beta subunit